MARITLSSLANGKLRMCLNSIFNAWIMLDMSDCGQYFPF